MFNPFRSVKKFLFPDVEGVRNVFFRGNAGYEICPKAKFTKILKDGEIEVIVPEGTYINLIRGDVKILSFMPRLVGPVQAGDKIEVLCRMGPADGFHVFLPGEFSGCVQVN